jgi:hypothetical protein
MSTGLQFIPKYVRQESDLAYGEKVTHENYNAKLNLNTTQGDYNTEVLFKLFNNLDAEDTYHIAYLDKDIEDINTDIENINTDIGNINTDLENINTNLENANDEIAKIKDGTTPIGHATLAEAIESGYSAGPSKYYGTDAESNLGFIPLPEFIYAEDVESSTGVDGIYFVPALNSVTESMLDAAVRLKLNREGITDYEYLSNLPKINSVTLIGNKSLSDLGIQPAGDYATNASVTAALSDYYTITAAQSWVNSQLTNYATTSALATTTNTANTASTTATNAYNRANACARVGINSYVSNPQNGDIYFAV